jgi:plastocyanin
MFRPFLAAALAAIAVSLPAAATGSPTATTLTAVVTPQATITLKNADGSAVRQLDPGEYAINVDDQTIDHNFHLSGPGVDQKTLVETTGMTTWTVTFGNGAYNFVCDVHRSTMKGSFNVGAIPVVPKLTARVTATAISLKNAAGVRVRAIPTNTYKIVVNDRSKKQNFHLIGPGVNRKTKVAALAKRTWTIQLQPGKYIYRSDKKRRLRGSFMVTSVPPPS